MTLKILTSIDELDGRIGLRPADRDRMETVCETFPFRASEYYLSLIDWDDPKDPLHRIVIPDPRELKGGGSLDPSCEKDYTRLPGLQHKYAETGLLLLSDVCGGICRFCFRKRLFIGRERETVRDVSDGIEYIRSHPGITNVLLTGGDPLTLPTRRLEGVLRELREIPHVGIVRIGSKIPAYDPHRILDDPELGNILRRYSTPEKRIYLMAHYNHPRELTETSLSAVAGLQRSGVVVVNQTPVLGEVNSEPETLAGLFRRLSFAGISPYYVFQCRPSLGNRFFQVPVEQSYLAIQKAWQACSGLAKRARFVMSHATGKIEVVGRTARHVFMRYHQAADPRKIGKFMIFRSNRDALWFDDYRDEVTDLPPGKTMRWLSS
ncbi:MAG TPA: radical SAM protein [Methanomicrobiales archaeon]|nr:radical SAM protein [Methanomicrobiales archaeon]